MGLPEQAAESEDSEASCSSCSHSHDNIHPDIMLLSSPLQGRGLFATAFIQCGTVVWQNKMDGPMESCYKHYQFSELTSLPEEAMKLITRFGSQLDETTIVGPSTMEEVEMDDTNFWNHSCDPNTWPMTEDCWVTRRDVYPGEEMTIDYITFDSNDYSGFPECRCGTTLCRKRITADDYKIMEVQKRYEGHFVPFIQKKIDAYVLTNQFVGKEDKETELRMVLVN